MSQPRMLAGMLLRQTYRIVGLVGHGGMGEVYEVTHERLAGRYAMKVLNLVTTARPESLARFRREAQITSGLQHPNVVHVLDFDTTDDGSPYLVMEYLDGPDLAQVLREQGRLPLARTVALLQQIGAGLSAAHRQGIVHRDLKPANVFVLPLGASGKELAKIVDFGISKTETPSIQLTGESAFLGTPQYMAPEQAIGKSSDVDARADQFALGVMAYEMLTGQRPFTGDTPIALVYQIINVEPPPLSTLVAGLPPALEAVVRRALAKRPEARYGSIDEFIAALEVAAGVAASSGGAAQVSGANDVASGVETRTRRRTGSLVAAVVGVLALGGVALALGALRSSSAHGDPPAPRSVSEPAPGPALVPAAAPAPKLEKKDDLAADGAPASASSKVEALAPRNLGKSERSETSRRLRPAPSPAAGGVVPARPVNPEGPRPPRASLVDEL